MLGRSIPHLVAGRSARAVAVAVVADSTRRPVEAVAVAVAVEGCPNRLAVEAVAASAILRRTSKLSLTLLLLLVVPRTTRSRR